MARTRGKRPIVLTLLVLFLPILGGRGVGTAAQATNPDLSGDLTVWAMGLEGEKLPGLAQEFMTAYPNVKVNVEPVPWDQEHQKRLTAVASGETPYVSQIGTTWMAELVETGALDEAPESLSGRAADFWEAAWASASVDETVYGAPWSVDTRVLFYRTDLLQQAGFAAPPAT